MFFENYDQENQIISILQQHGGILRTSELLGCGVHPRVLYQMRDTGRIVELSWGIFALPEYLPAANSDLITTALRIPAGVICLVSALSFHELTDEIPHEIYLALPRRKSTPKIDYPPVRVFHFSDETISVGVEVHNLYETEVKIFSPEKTVADCFKFRNKIGLDVAIEGLKMCLSRNGSRSKILEYARLCRVEKVISPYLQSVS
jgi:predicted transcriptional regulator of viral defense system